MVRAWIIARAWPRVRRSQEAAVGLVVEHGDRHQDLQVGGADLVDHRLLGLEEGLAGAGVPVEHDRRLELDQLVRRPVRLAGRPSRARILR